jgi:hypothetical protein
MFLLRTCVVLAITLLTGCANEPPRFTGLIAPPPGKAVVYVYRTDLYVNTPYRLAPVIRVNSREVAPLLKHQYLRVVLEPGQSELYIDSHERTNESYWKARTPASVKLTLPPGSTRFVELVIDKVSFSFREVSGERATQELPKLRPAFGSPD